MKTFIRIWACAPGLRWPARIVDHAGRILPRTPGVELTFVELPYCSATLYTPAVVDSDRCVLYLHGGAFYVGGRHLHRQMISRIADRLSVPILAVDYRKFPHRTISDAVDDCIEGYRYLLGEGVRPDRITIMGDSAGGYLSLVVGAVLRKNGLPAPGAIVVISPLADLDHTAKLAAKTNCAVFPASAVHAFGREMQRRPGRFALTSPVDADLTGFPPTLVQAGRRELLYSDAVVLAQRLHAAGRTYELHTWDTAVHVFQAATHTPESAQSIEQIADFVDRHVPRALVRHAL